MSLSRLSIEFYQSSGLPVARGLLGARLVRLFEGQRLTGYILETEAYLGEEDLACHARAGRTTRTAVMYGPPGRAYIYFVYGMHWMLNVVTGLEGDPQAVLLRAIWPVEGIDAINARRAGAPRQSWPDGPGKLCRAMNIDGSLNNVDLTAPDSPLYIEPGLPVPDESIITGPRVGIDKVPEPWRSKPWRYRLNPRLWRPNLEEPL